MGRAPRAPVTLALVGGLATVWIFLLSWDPAPHVGRLPNEGTDPRAATTNRVGHEDFHAPPVAPHPGPPGTCYLPAGDALIGTRAEELTRLVGPRGPNVLRSLDFERPQHRRWVREAWVDRNEITNAQYHRFLKDHAAVYVCDGRVPTLVEVAGELLRTLAPEQDDVAWRQLAEANKDALEMAMPDVMAAPGAVWPDAFKHAILPKRDLSLFFYSLRPPDDWPSGAPAEERLDHPVRYVSGLDLDLFSEWAGKHLQTEFEYEYAARSRDGLAFPWGNIWHDGDGRCNWGLKVKNAKQEGDTWAVGSRPEGRSWIGCNDLIGNVSEWTSSLFTRYPGNANTHEFQGAVRVIRGGAAVDRETLVLRPAYRNFIGLGFNAAPPYPQNRYAWVGGRCAWWSQPGANQAPYIQQRVARGGRLKPASLGTSGLWEGGDLDLERLSGAVAEDFDPDPQNGVWVKGRCKAEVLIPLRSLVRVDDERVGLNYSRVKSGKEGLLKESESDEPVLILGAFHTDVRLPNVWRRRAKVLGAPRRQRGPGALPDLEQGTVAPGSYLLALWHRKLCLVDGHREFRYCLTPPDETPTLNHVKFTAGQPPPACTVRVDDELNRVSGVLSLPVATGKGTDPLQWVVVSFSLDALADDVASPFGWR